MQFFFLVLFSAGFLKPSFFLEQTESSEERNTREVKQDDFEPYRNELRSYTGKYKKVLERKTEENNILPRDMESYCEIRKLDVILGNPHDNANFSAETCEQKCFTLKNKISTEAEDIRSQLETLKRTIMTVEATANNLSRAGGNQTRELLTKESEKLSAKIDDNYLLLNKTMKHIEEVLNGLSTMVISQSKILRELVPQNNICNLSRDLKITHLTNGMQFYYGYDRPKTTWLVAKSFCETHGMTLPILDFEEEFKATKAGITVPGHYWVSANDVGHEPANHHWTNGKKVKNSWLDGLNQFGPRRDTCLYLHRYSLTDAACTEPERIMCQRPSHCE